MNSLYPLWIEKLVFIGLIAVAAYGGIMLQDYISGLPLWLTRICVLPVVILVLTEGIGRTIQSIYSR
tara:strand:+ start:109 stop:309 length:201 start_codon:yes stop_codon:yes gene_type:complete